MLALLVLLLLRQRPKHARRRVAGRRALQAAPDVVPAGPRDARSAPRPRCPGARSGACGGPLQAAGLPQNMAAHGQCVCLVSQLPRAKPRSDTSQGLVEARMLRGLQSPEHLHPRW